MGIFYKDKEGPISLYIIIHGIININLKREGTDYGKGIF